MSDAKRLTREQIEDIRTHSAAPDELVRRLRRMWERYGDGIYKEAADRIESDTAEKEELKKERAEKAEAALKASEVADPTGL